MVRFSISQNMETMPSYTAKTCAFCHLEFGFRPEVPFRPRTSPGRPDRRISAVLRTRPPAQFRYILRRSAYDSVLAHTPSRSILESYYDMRTIFKPLGAAIQRSGPNRRFGFLYSWFSLSHLAGTRIFALMGFRPPYTDEPCQFLLPSSCFADSRFLSFDV